MYVEADNSAMKTVGYHNSLIKYGSDVYGKAISWNSMKTHVYTTITRPFFLSRQVKA